MLTSTRLAEAVLAVMQESLSGSDTYSEVCASLGKGSSDSGRVLVGTGRLGAFSP